MSLPPAAQNFFLSFSDGSAGGLVSGKGKGGRLLSIHELLCVELLKNIIRATIWTGFGLFSSLCRIKTMVHTIMRSIWLKKLD
jgi:hypothetical protein